MAAHDALGDQFSSPFSVEDDVLHIHGRPFPMAQLHHSGKWGMDDSPGEFKEFKIPTEQGHELYVAGHFLPSGQLSGPVWRHRALSGSSYEHMIGAHMDATAWLYPSPDEHRNYYFKPYGREQGMAAHHAPISSREDLMARWQELGEMPGRGRSRVR